MGWPEILVRIIAGPYVLWSGICITAGWEIPFPAAWPFLGLLVIWNALQDIGSAISAASARVQAPLAKPK